MAKSWSGTFVLTLVAFMVADGSRLTGDAIQDVSGTTKCIAEGVSGGADGMYITWGSSNAIKECGPTDGEGFTYEHKFSEAFSVSFGKKCDCSINMIKEEPIVSFKPRTLHQARVCAGTETDADPMEIKRQCWDAYMRGRGTTFREVGEMRIPEYRVPWLSGNFRVSREGACNGEDCNSINLPGVLEGMSREHKRAIGDGIKKIMDGERDKVPKALQELIDILPEAALDDAEFQQIDEDGDGTLTLHELHAFYPHFEPSVLKKFIDEVDDNDSGTVDPEEFSALKEKMRDYDPSTDLIDGPVAFELSKTGDVEEAKAEWKVATLVCMKGGKPAPGECEDNEADALREYNTNC